SRSAAPPRSSRRLSDRSTASASPTVVSAAARNPIGSWSGSSTSEEGPARHPAGTRTLRDSQLKRRTEHTITCAGQALVCRHPRSPRIFSQWTLHHVSTRRTIPNAPGRARGEHTTRGFGAQERHELRAEYSVMASRCHLVDRLRGRAPLGTRRFLYRR